MAAVIELVMDDDGRDEAMRREESRLSKIDAAGIKLKQLCDEAIRGRIDIEKRWMREEDAYYGRPTLNQQTNKEFAATDADYRKASDNITRPKVRLFASRLADMLFPTSENNYEIDAHPIPDPSNPAQMIVDPQTGEQRTAAQLMAELRAEALKRARSMQQKIERQLDECAYNAHGRKSCHQAALHGTFAFERYVANRRDRFTALGADGQVTRREKRRDEFAVRCVDLWTLYPQPCRDIKEAEHYFKLELMPKRSVRALAKQVGFHPKQLARLLKSEPDMSALKHAAVITRGTTTSIESVMQDRYPVFRFVGPLPKELAVLFLESLIGIDQLPEGLEGVDEVVASIHAMLQDLMDDERESIYAEVYMSGGYILKIVPMDMDDEDHLPLYVENLEKDPDSWAGFGVAHWMADDQVSAEQMWHAIMLNGMMSAGPQIGVIGGRVEPRNGKRDLSCVGPKVWNLTDEIEDINKAFTVFMIPSVLDRLLPVYEQIKRNADERTLMPLVLQGDATRVGPTATGQGMAINQANFAIQEFAKDFDENITTPIIRDAVNWNMANDPDPSIKGDFVIIPRVAGHLLIKELKAARMQALTQLSALPHIQGEFKPRVIAERNVLILDEDPEDWLKSEEEKRADQEAMQQSAGQNPDILRAQAAMKQAEASMGRAQAESQARIAEAESRNRAMELGHAEKQMDLMDRDNERQSKMLLAQMEMELELLKAGAAVASKERIAALQKEIVEFRMAATARIEAAKLAQRERSENKQIVHESPVRF
jgi:hypothetical protein